MTDKITREELLKRALNEDDLIIVFTGPEAGYESSGIEKGVADMLVEEGLLKKVRIVSPFHDMYKLTRKGRKVAKTK